MSDDAKVPLPEPANWYLAPHATAWPRIYTQDQLRAYGDARERAARAAAFDEAIAAIKAMPFGYGKTAGPARCIAAIEKVRARAEGQSNG